jgi:hypothetical protein
VAFEMSPVSTHMSFRSSPACEQLSKYSSFVVSIDFSKLWRFMNRGGKVYRLKEIKLTAPRMEESRPRCKGKVVKFVDASTCLWGINH